jgi:hypothetical protein
MTRVNKISLIVSLVSALFFVVCLLVLALMDVDPRKHPLLLRGFLGAVLLIFIIRTIIDLVRDWNR